MRKIASILIPLTLSLAFLGCPPKSENGAATGSEGGEILVGEYSSLSGSEATFGDSTHKGIMLAVDEINAAGGVKGRKIKVITEDTQSKPEEAANAVTKLISQDQVVAILGEVASSSSLAAAPIAQLNKVPMITPSSTNPTVTEKGDYIFRMCFIDPYQGEAMAKYLAGTGVKKAAILIDVKSDYSTGLAKFFRETFVANGGTITTTGSYSKGDNDFRAQLNSIKATNPQVIFVPGYYNDIGQIAIQAREIGINQPLVGGDGWESPKLIEIGGKSLEGGFYSNHYYANDPAPAVRDFVQKFEARYKAKPDAMAALAYDSVRVLAEAMTRASSLEGPALRDEIAKTKGFSGVTGTITLGPDRNPVAKKLVIMEVKDGGFVLKATVDPAGAASPATATDTTGTTGTTATTATPAATSTAPAAAPATGTTATTATK
jgi:branched-chain amino acid transport system substrate-binding protein